MIRGEIIRNNERSSSKLSGIQKNFSTLHLFWKQHSELMSALDILQHGPLTHKLGAATATLVYSDIVFLGIMTLILATIGIGQRK